MEDFKELYYRQPYVREFDASVVSCEPSADAAGRFEVTLSETAFYPEGGGQPGDRGTLRLPTEDAEGVAAEGLPAEAPADAPAADADAPTAADADPAANDGASAPESEAPEPAAPATEPPAVRVLDTRKRGDAVVHLTDAPLPVGAQVHGALDWTWRSDNMEGHTGEHILSGIVHALYGYDNVGFHMGEDCITVDFSGLLDESQALEVERRANQAVRADLEVRELLPSAAELATMSYRSKKELEGVVRIVSIPGVDTCACCGTHVSTTGQVGLVKILSVSSKKKGARVELLCGRRALLAYEAEMAQVHGISTLLSAKTGEVLDAVRRLDDEKNELRRQLQQAHRQRLDLEVRALPERSGLVVRIEDGLSVDELRYFCNRALEAGRATTVAALSRAAADSEGASAEDAPARFDYVMASSDAAVDLRAAVKELNVELNGRGGGKPEMVQGSFTAPRGDIETALRARLS
jgi:alanyl-tRNA synthetase